jgi:hypothetical protein
MNNTAATTTAPNTFQVGETVTARSACDSDCVFEWTVTRRSARFVTFTDRTGRAARVGVHTDQDGAEWAMPQGTFSMAPVVRAQAAR